MLWRKLSMMRRYRVAKGMVWRAIFLINDQFKERAFELKCKQWKRTSFLNIWEDNFNRRCCNWKPQGDRQQQKQNSLAGWADSRRMTEMVLVRKARVELSRSLWTMRRKWTLLYWQRESLKCPQQKEWHKLIDMLNLTILVDSLQERRPLTINYFPHSCKE